MFMSVCLVVEYFEGMFVMLKNGEIVELKFVEKE